MNITHIYVALVATIICSCSEAPSWQEVDLTLPYEHPTQIAKLYEKSGESGLAARQYSEAGMYDAANEVISSKTAAADDTTLTLEILKSFKWVDADSLILQRAAKHDLVLFNEDHNLPHARVMVLDLLTDLRAMGFEYLALEALATIEGQYAYDSLIHERGYPIAYSGIYTREATFSLLVRKASKLGFKIIGYDQGSGSERESKGARNIVEQITHNHMIAKTIVLCGWDHIREGKTHTYWEYALAERLHQLTGLDPLTIANTTFVNQGDKAKNSGIVNAMPHAKRLILLNKHVDTSYSEQKHPYYDLEVFQPSVEHVLPWRTADTDCLSSSVLPDSLGQDAMLYLYAPSDDVRIAVPTYRTPVNDSATCYPLMYKDQQVVITDGQQSYIMRLN